MNSMGSLRLWNAYERLFLYGLFGFASEVCFTATWEALENGNRKLIGVTSMYVFFVYGISILFMERLYLCFKDFLTLPFRAAIYVFVCYIWEFSIGFFLKRWDACPWDYERFITMVSYDSLLNYFHYHFMGLITFEYIPVWYVSSIVCEIFVIRYVLYAAWGASGYVFQVSTPSDRSQTPIEITPINIVTILKQFVASGRATFIFRSPAVRVMVQKDDITRALPISLIELNMTDNELGSFPNSLLQLRNLRSLSLSRNRLTEIPTDVGFIFIPFITKLNI
uniref:Transmembrane protein n=1 Tax=Heterorhabditis bacteriophora TaxID=37862 RepID=A0A1I7XUF0_HETBA